MSPAGEYIQALAIEKSSAGRLEIIPDVRATNVYRGVVPFAFCAVRRIGRSRNIAREPRARLAIFLRIEWIVAVPVVFAEHQIDVRPRRTAARCDSPSRI